MYHIVTDQSMCINRTIISFESLWVATEFAQDIFVEWLVEWLVYPTKYSIQEISDDMCEWIERNAEEGNTVFYLGQEEMIFVVAENELLPFLQQVPSELQHLQL